MREVTGLCVVALIFLIGRTGAMQPNNGYCIGSQCFVVFQSPRDYESAQTDCAARNSHLMTVRSSVSHDILPLLLGNFTGRFWIGLRRTSACPDAAAELRGFQWVTKDSESDFSNWAPSFDSSCSSHSCISVSQRSDFKWTQDPCGGEADGFLCEYAFTEPCKGLVVAAGESVIYWTPFGFVGEDLVSLPPGSIATRMPDETKSVCFSEQWLQAPWNCEIQEGGCEYKCATDPNNVPSCYCPPGQAVNPQNKVTCEAVAADPCLPLGCQHTCYKDGGSYACICDHGFQLASDGRSCVDFNDCLDERQCPGENFVCVNIVGGFQCVCENGFRMSGDLCVDVDECASAPCEHDCTNTAGSYRCSCFEGFKEDPESPDKCKLHCGKMECPAECDPNDRYQCNCPDGYIVDERDTGVFCVDIDECSSFYCDQLCKNTFGSYVCSCSPGYTLVNQYKCEISEDDYEGSTMASTPYTFSTSPVPDPEPTKSPSGVTVGGLVGIIVCTVIFIVIVVFLAHHILSGRGKMDSAGALKAPEGEAHGLHKVTSDN